jgi:hypothetical protein
MFSKLIGPNYTYFPCVKRNRRRPVWGIKRPKLQQLHWSFCMANRKTTCPSYSSNTGHFAWQTEKQHGQVTAVTLAILHGKQKNNMPKSQQSHWPFWMANRKTTCVSLSPPGFLYVQRRTAFLGVALHMSSASNIALLLSLTRLRVGIFSFTTRKSTALLGRGKHEMQGKNVILPWRPFAKNLFPQQSFSWENNSHSSSQNVPILLHLLACSY